MKSKTTETDIRSQLGSVICLIFVAAVMSCNSGRDDARIEDRRGEILESDYAGKVAAALGGGGVGIDSVKFAQYAYQLAALDDGLYKLHSALAKSFFDACNQRCGRRSCVSGDIAAAAMAYCLDNDLDFAVSLCELIEGYGTPSKEAAEISRVIRILASVNAREALTELDRSGALKTPSGIAFWAVAALENGLDPKAWVRKPPGGKSEALEKQYAAAYAAALTAGVRSGWEMLPKYAPLARDFPPPSFVEDVRTSDSVYTQKIYLPLCSYIRMRLDKMLLEEALAENYPAANQIDLAAIKSLAAAKGLWSGEIPPADESAAADPRAELVRSLAMAGDGSGIDGRLNALRHPVARAAFLKSVVDATGPAAGADLGQVIVTEVGNTRDRIIWESRILLSEAMLGVMTAPDAFRLMGNYAVSDLSVRNNSPEWLTTYARAGLSEASQLSLVTQLIYNLSQHYPQAIGLYEIVQNYNHLCKYY